MNERGAKRNDVMAENRFGRRNDVLALPDLPDRNDVLSFVPERCAGGPHVVSDATDASDYAAELAAQVERWTGNATHVVTVGSKDLRRMRRAREAILADWERDLVVIVGGRDALRVAS